MPDYCEGLANSRYLARQAQSLCNLCNPRGRVAARRSHPLLITCFCLTHQLFVHMVGPQSPTDNAVRSVQCAVIPSLEGTKLEVVHSIYLYLKARDRLIWQTYRWQWCVHYRVIGTAGAVFGYFGERMPLIATSRESRGLFQAKHVSQLSTASSTSKVLLVLSVRETVYL